MRIIIFGDLHANVETLVALNMVEQPPDAVFFLGDAVGYGPDPAPCVDWLRRFVKHAVRGDHDYAVATGAEFATPPELLPLAQATSAHTLRMLRANDLRWLAGLPTTLRVELGGAKFFLAHASPRNPASAGLDFATMSEDALRAECAGMDADVILLGHTHVPALRKIGNTHIVNPGSLGQPRHGLPSATYAVWEDGNLRIKHIDYDPSITQRKLALMMLEPHVEKELSHILGKGILSA